jgi:hypothetical protein
VEGKLDCAHPWRLREKRHFSVFYQSPFPRMGEALRRILLVLLLGFLSEAAPFLLQVQYPALDRKARSVSTVIAWSLAITAATCCFTVSSEIPRSHGDLLVALPFRDVLSTSRSRLLAPVAAIGR